MNYWGKRTTLNIKKYSGTILIIGEMTILLDRNTFSLPLLNNKKVLEIYILLIKKKL
jgi:hypothetical protein